jgi:sugar phosphate isomerase/epimerase
MSATSNPQKNAPPFILDHITAAGLDCTSLVELAARTGFDGVSFWVCLPDPNLQIETLALGTPRFAEIKAALSANNLFVSGVECFGLTGAPPTDANRRQLEAAAEIGARLATVLFFAPLPQPRAAELLVQWAELAASFGLDLSVEYMSANIAPGMNSLAQTLEAIALANRPNLGLTIDMLHLSRTATPPEALAAVPPGLIKYIQLCDGPAHMPPERQLEEGAFNRLLPDEGDFKLDAYLSNLPKNVPLGLEVPRRGMAAADLARRGLAASKRVLRRNGW